MIIVYNIEFLCWQIEKILKLLKQIWMMAYSFSISAYSICHTCKINWKIVWHLAILTFLGSKWKVKGNAITQISKIVFLLENSQKMVKIKNLLNSLRTKDFRSRTIIIELGRYPYTI